MLLDTLELLSTVPLPWLLEVLLPLVYEEEFVYEDELGLL